MAVFNHYEKLFFFTNIPDVCYNNIKYAMLSQLQNPPPEFADVIKSHFFWKKQRVLEVSLWPWPLTYFERVACVLEPYSQCCHLFQEVEGWVKKHNNKRLERMAQNLKQELKKLHHPPNPPS